MAAVASGKLRHKVQLQEERITQDPDTGEMVSSWVTYAEPWVDMNHQSVRDFVAAGAQQSEVRGFALMRFRDDVSAGHRIIHRGRWYRILGVMPDNESGLEHLSAPYSEGVRLSP